MGRTFLAVDIGASSGRHIVGRIEDGRLTTREVYRFSNCAVNTADGLYWQTDRLIKEVLNGLTAAKEHGFIPDFVGIDTWGVDYALLSDGNIIDGVRCYRDGRTAAAVEAAHGIVPF